MQVIQIGFYLYGRPQGVARSEGRHGGLPYIVYVIDSN